MYKVTSYKNIIQDTEPWHSLRKTPGQLNSSSIYKYLGNRCRDRPERKNYGKRTKVVQYRERIHGEIEHPPEEVSEFLQNIFDQGHEGEKRVKEICSDVLEETSYYVVESENCSLRVGVSPDSRFNTGVDGVKCYIPVEIKTQTVGNDWYMPPLKYQYQLLWQCIALGSNEGIIVRLCRDDTIQRWKFRWDIHAYYEAFENFYINMDNEEADKTKLCSYDLFNLHAYRLPWEDMGVIKYFEYDKYNVEDFSDVIYPKCGRKVDS